MGVIKQRNRLRKGLDILRQNLIKAKEKCQKYPEIDIYLTEAEKLIKQSENWSNRKKIKKEEIDQAAETALKALRLLDSLDLRISIALFRRNEEYLKMRSRIGTKNMSRRQLRILKKKSPRILDEASSFLDKGMKEKALEILEKHHHEKVFYGLAGPVIVL